MDQEALRRAKLLLIVKFLHELQHRATRLYFNHVASTPASEPAAKVHLSSKLNSPTSMGTRSRSAHKMELRHTPGRIGSVTVGGIARGDSGYALEELLLGGRLRHRHLYRGAHFDVSAQARLRMHLLSIFLSFLVQIRKVILMTDETATKVGKERWYTDAYVTKQLQRLESGTCMQSLS